MCRLPEAVEAEVYSEHYEAYNEGKQCVYPQSGARKTPYGVAVVACEEGSNQRCETVGEADTCENGDVEKIVYKRRRGQSICRVVPDHNVVGKAHGYIAELPQEKRKRQLTDSTVIVGVYR